MVVKLEDEGDMEQGLSALKKEHIVGMTRAWCKQRDVSLEVEFEEAGFFAVIPCTYAAGVASKFRINLWTHTAHSGYQGERPEVRGDAKCVIRELGTNDLGYDSESPLSEDECEADEESVVCALLHDIGDLHAPDNHAAFAATILAPYVSERSEWIVRHHGIFQGYYYAHHWGRDRHARERFRAHRWFADCARFCERWDQVSFDPDYDTLELETFVPMVERIFARPSFENHGRREGSARL